MTLSGVAISGVNIHGVDCIRLDISKDIVVAYQENYIIAIRRLLANYEKSLHRNIPLVEKI